MTITRTGLQLVSGGQEGSLKVWDLRKVGATIEEPGPTKPLCVVEKSHGKKYDEGVLCMELHPSQPFIASGGADSVVQVFELLA